MSFLLDDETFVQYVDSLSVDDELEISFHPKLSRLSLDKFRTLLQYFAQSEYTVETSNTLNVLYNYDHDMYNMYRITVLDIDNIESIVNEMKNKGRTSNNYIFSILFERLKSERFDYLSGMDKKRTKEGIHDNNALGIRIRKASELNIPDNIELSHTDQKYIKYRYIQRTSLIIVDNASYTIRVDLSYVKSGDKLLSIDRNNANIELEIDLSVKKALKKADHASIKNEMNEIYITLQKVLQKSNNIVNVDEQNSVVTKMKELLIPGERGNMRDLPSMRPVSAEIQHIVDHIGHDYCVTDKADGNHCFMFIVDDEIMILTDSLEVKKVDGYEGISSYNNTILEGEYIFNPEHQKFMFLAYDCLFFKGEDKRPTKCLTERLECVREVTRNVFGHKNSFAKYEGDFDFKKMKKYYESDIKKHYDEVNKKLKGDTPINIVFMKYFAIPQGVHLCEIFFLTDLIWTLCTTNSNIDCPYNLDGCILTPLQQEYTRVAGDIKKRIFKVKFRKDNSIDLYLEYERDPLTNQIIDIYNDAEANTDIAKMNNKEFENNVETIDTVQLKPKGQLYRIGYLHVGKRSGDNEYPVLFHEQQDHHFIHLYLKDGEPRDVEGNIIQDKTVIECTYDNNPLISQGDRWTVLRTRYDKTNMVNMYKRQYGNNSSVAESIWQSMIDGIEASDIALLGDVNTYADHHKKLRGMITTTMIEQERRENAYYNYNNKMGASLRDFHNWVKSNLIYTYATVMNTADGKEQLDLLDYGCGVGGDIGKFLAVRLKSYVGFDLDYNGIHSGSDGAISRSQTWKKKMNVISFPMKFFVADGGALLNVKDQEKAIGNIDEGNTNIIRQYFDNPNPKLYGVVSCQFVVHYFFKNDQTLNNFIQNIKTFTKPSAYLIFTTFDANLVDKDLQKGPITSHITTPEGDKKIIFDVKKRYEGELQNITGQAIDVHLPSFDEDKYVVEYLVPPQLFIDKMKDNGFTLIDTDMFWNVFNKHKNFFQYVQEEEKVAMKNYYMKVKEYYNTNDVANQSYYPFTQKNRYYVFQKDTDTSNKVDNKKSTNKKKK